MVYNRFFCAAVHLTAHVVHPIVRSILARVLLGIFVEELVGAGIGEIDGAELGVLVRELIGAGLGELVGRGWTSKLGSEVGVGVGANVGNASTLGLGVVSEPTTLT